jgi:predicted membrane protein
VTTDRIIGLVGIAVAVLSAFVTIPHVFTILVIAGLIVGFRVASADHVRLIVTALALFLFAPTLGTAPYVGKYLAVILVSGGYMAMGAAIMAILQNLYERFRPVSKTAPG